MKKLALLVLVSVLLIGCGKKEIQENVSEPTQISQEKTNKVNIFQNEYVVLETARLQALIDKGEITEDQAGEMLQKSILEFKRVNDGSLELILRKIEAMDKTLAKELEKRIRQHHPELFTN